MFAWLFGKRDKKKTRALRIEEQEKVREEQEQQIEELFVQHEHIKDQECEQCKKLEKVLDKKTATAVQSREISDRKIKGQRKTDILRLPRSFPESEAGA